MFGDNSTYKMTFNNLDEIYDTLSDIIDETYKRTNLKHLNIGSAVNVEYDIIIKYLEKINHDN